MDIQFTEEKETLSDLKTALTRLQSTHVEIGLPVSAPARSHILLALHEHGAPGAHIPPRPVMRPALATAETQHAIQEGLIAACEAAAAGDSDGVLSGFQAAGQAGVDGIHAYIDAGISPHNAPLTVCGGWIRNFSSGKPVHVEGKGFDKPIDLTGSSQTKDCILLRLYFQSARSYPHSGQGISRSSSLTSSSIITSPMSVWWLTETSLRTLSNTPISFIMAMQ